MNKTVGFSPDKSNSDKSDLNDQQKKLLRVVITEHNGDAIAAAKAVGYSNPWAAVKVLRKELAELAEDVLGKLSIKAALKLGDVMESDKPMPQASEKIKAALAILDRTNPKVDRLDVSGEVKGGIFILPDKRSHDE